MLLGKPREGQPVGALCVAQVPVEAAVRPGVEVLQNQAVSGLTGGVGFSTPIPFGVNEMPPAASPASDEPGDLYSAPPYYLNAKLKVRNFRASGTWRDQDCGSAGANIPGNDTQFGRDWMDAVCREPP